MRRRTQGDVCWREGRWWKKNLNQHNSFPPISSMYNIKAIKGCFCQRILGNTLVSGWERERAGEMPKTILSIKQNTHTCHHSNKCQCFPCKRAYQAFRTFPPACLTGPIFLLMEHFADGLLFHQLFCSKVRWGFEMRRFDPGLHIRKHLNRKSPGIESRTGSKWFVETVTGMLLQ